METKGLKTPFGVVFLGVLILSLVETQPRVEAACCQGPWGQTCYQACLLTPAHIVPGACEATCGCTCSSSGYDYPAISPLKNSAGAYNNEYCKLGCASSTCKAIISILKNSGDELVVKEATEQCSKTCSKLCTNQDSTIALKTA